MEFKIKNINQSEPVYITPEMMGEDEMWFRISHNGIGYDTLFDDVLYMYGSVARKLTVHELNKFSSIGDNSVNQKGIRLQLQINYNSMKEEIRFFLYNIFRNRICIREPEDPTQIMVIEKEIKTIEQVVKYVDREVEKIKTVIIVKEIEQLELCPICYDNKAFMFTKCCSLHQCLDCVLKACKKGKCPQCRRSIKYDDLTQDIVDKKPSLDDIVKNGMIIFK